MSISEYSRIMMSSRLFMLSLQCTGVQYCAKTAKRVAFILVFCD